MNEVEYENIGEYKVLKHLGAGGMGDVYKVRHTISGRVEAMKLVRPQLLGNKLAEERFQREIQVLAELDHPNIARLFTAIRVEGSIAMIMEYIEGATVERFLQDGPLTLEEIKFYTSHVLSALAYAHERGVVHRDIKPANCMVTGKGVVKLMDFGLARSTSQRRVTSAGSTAGTYAYMPPEQIQGQQVDARTDLYALGVTMFEMATGVLPFPHDTDYSLMTAHLNEQPRRPIDLSPNLPVPLNNIILKLLEKDPGNRYQGANEVEEALRSVQETATPMQAANAVRRVTEVDGKVHKPEPSTGPGQVRRTPTHGMDVPVPSPPLPQIPPPPPHRPWIAMALGAVIVVGAAGGGLYVKRHPIKAADPQPVVVDPLPKPQDHPNNGPPGGPKQLTPEQLKDQQVTAERRRREEATRQKAIFDAKNTLPPVVIKRAEGTTASSAGTDNVTPGPLAPPTGKRVLTPPEQARLTQANILVTSIESGASGVNPIIDATRRDLAQHGGVLRQDVTDHQSGMRANIYLAREAVKAADPDSAATYANKAQTDLDYLKHWAGQR